MSLSVAEIAAKLGGRFEGSGSIVVTKLAALKEAGPGDITFLSNPRYASEVPHTRASAVIVTEAWSGTCPAAVIRVKDPNRAVTEVALWFAEKLTPVFSGIHPTAVIAPDVQLGRDVVVGPHCVLEPGVKVGDRSMILAGCYLGHGTQVGADCKFYPHVSTREYSRIGSRVILHNGVVIGSDGFGYEREPNKKWKKIPQIGVVVVGDDVELGANTTVDRARFGETRIGNGVKIDNQVQVAHNVIIGDDTAMAAQVGISGSAEIGARVQMGGQVGVNGHIRIGDDCIVGPQAGVSKSVPDGLAVLGAPAQPFKKMLELNAHIMRLPDFKQHVAELEARIRSLEEKIKQG